MHITENISHPISKINGVLIQVNERIWTDGRRSFDVFMVGSMDILDYSDICLTVNESFDSYPTDAQIANLLNN